MRYSILEINSSEYQPHYKYRWYTDQWDEKEYNDEAYWLWKKGKGGNYKYYMDREQIIVAFTENHPLYNWFILPIFDEEYNFLAGWDERSWKTCDAVYHWFIDNHKKPRVKKP